jgi:hypothetical protein
LEVVSEVEDKTSASFFSDCRKMSLGGVGHVKDYEIQGRGKPAAKGRFGVILSGSLALQAAPTGLMILQAQQRGMISKFRARLF